MGAVLLEGERGDTESCLEYFNTLRVDRGARILDIGCRYGSLLQNFHLAGYADVHGVDVDAAAVARGAAAYPELAGRLHAYDGTHLPFQEGSFDAITMFDVIEHIGPIDEYLKNVRRLLRPGGLFIFQTPNILIDVPYWVLALRLFNREKLAWLFREHCSLQTYPSLKRLLRGAGFTDIRIEKNRSDTEFKKEYVRKTLGPVGLAILHASNHFPMVLYPNFWGHARG
ncbi:class I SAM-dependent methyltransferase [Azospirillum sp.]|uniref:class I SAM-dependent methyltransferase n=1 Tax=Azospirillum sp. TaxID=34012 RepID=UPI003D7511BD